MPDRFIQRKAKRIFAAMEIGVRDEWVYGLNFSNVCLTTFQKRNHLNSYKLHGERADADVVGAAASLLTLRDVVVQFGGRKHMEF